MLFSNATKHSSFSATHLICHFQTEQPAWQNVSTFTFMNVFLASLTGHCDLKETCEKQRNHFVLMSSQSCVSSKPGLKKKKTQINILLLINAVFNTNGDLKLYFPHKRSVSQAFIWRYKQPLMKCVQFLLLLYRLHFSCTSTRKLSVCHERGRFWVSYFC